MGVHLIFIQMEEIRMPTPAQIIDAVSLRFGISRKTVALYDRLLVVHGYRKISGRGRSAFVTFGDAAALIIAVAATPITGAALNIANFESYAGLRATNLTAGDVGGWTTVSSLVDLAEGHTLHDGLTRILTSLSEGTLIPSSNGQPLAKGQCPVQATVSIDFYAPWPRASITIECLSADGSTAILAETVHYWALGDHREKYWASGPIDFFQTRSFGLVTLWTIVEIFSGGPQPRR
jgi:hypothetical protein